MKGRCKKKKTIIIILCVIIYMIAGAIAPFVLQKDVSEKFKNQFDVNEFYGDDISVDRAKIIETNAEALSERLRLLDKAKEKIVFASYDLRDGESTRDTLAVLLAKAEEGVKIQILIDGINSLIRMEGRNIFYALSSHPNVEIKLYNPLKILQPWKTQGRMHDKYILVDDLGYILGGRNAHDSFIGGYEAKATNIDREVLIYNSAHGTEKSKESSITELEAYIDEVWNLKENELFHNGETVSDKPKVKKEREFLIDRYAELQRQWPELFVEYNYEDNTLVTNKVSILSNPTHIYGKEPWVFYSLVELMNNAEDTVRIYSPYAVLDDYMLNSLRGISKNIKDFKLVINSVENGDNLFASSDYIRNKKKIIDTGASIYEYDSGLSTHGKSVAVDDDISIIGSFNFDMRSTYVSTELMVVINSYELTKELKENMERMEKDSRKVINENIYETPDHIEVNKANPVKRFLWWFLGLIMSPFRFLV